MSDTTRPKSTGDKLSADEINQDLPVQMTAGETINGDTLPVAIYIKDSDGEVYACDADDQDALDFIGFAISNSTDGNDITVQTKGIVSGFSGLDASKKYYVQDAVGTIGTSIGTYEVLVGIAISATELLIQKGSFEYMGSASDSSDVITVPAGARFAIVRINSSKGSNQVIKGEVHLSRIGKTGGSISYTENALGVGAISGSAGWSGSSITLSFGGNATAVSGTAYFYR
jgi:hypothetical protein